MYKTNTIYCINLPIKAAQSILYVLRCFFWQIYAIICFVYHIKNFLLCFALRFLANLSNIICLINTVHKSITYTLSFCLLEID